MEGQHLVPRNAKPLGLPSLVRPWHWSVGYEKVLMMMPPH